MFATITLQLPDNVYGKLLRVAEIYTEDTTRFSSHELIVDYLYRMIADEIDDPFVFDPEFRISIARRTEEIECNSGKLIDARELLNKYRERSTDDESED